MNELELSLTNKLALLLAFVLLYIGLFHTSKDDTYDSDY